MKLNLGCGLDVRDGFVNVDLNAFHRPDIVSDVCRLPIADGLFDELLAQDVLEHLPRARCETALKEWNRIARRGAHLTLRVPGLAQLLDSLSNSGDPAQHDTVVQSLYGTQGYTGDFHLNGFTEAILHRDLDEAGFSLKGIDVQDGWLLHAVAEKTLDKRPDELLDIVDDATFVAEAYRRLFGREADPEGYNHYLALLEDGTAREAVLSVLRSSPEFMARTG